jgi:hypothetical protein
MVPGFQHTGTWYDFFGGNTINVSDLAAPMNFQPGEYHVYFDQPIFAPDTALNVEEAIELFGFNFMVYPNPASDRVTIGLKTATSGKVSVDLLDLSGRIIDHSPPEYKPSNGIAATLLPEHTLCVCSAMQ